jgi:starch-binding outer membrane protein, SusD/RagB family
MKIIYKLLFLLFLMLGYSSCDFLNIVPDEITTEEDAFKDRNAAKNFVYSSLLVRMAGNEAAASSNRLHIHSTHSS